ncbi:MAG: transposase, partial [bacterium]|nr:transposase [bacterium]
MRAIDLVRTHTQRRGIWAIDRGGDRKKLLEPLLEWGERFVSRSMGKRSVIDRRKLRGSVAEVAGKCRLRHQAQIIKIHDGVEETLELRYGAEPIRLPDRDETLLLVVVSGFGKQPLMLLTNLSAARDSSTLWWIVQIYLTRWKIEETFRFIKQSYNLEDIRVLKYQRLKNLTVLVT